MATIVVRLADLEHAARAEDRPRPDLASPVAHESCPAIDASTLWYFVDHELAVERLRTYFGTGEYTGGQFERFGGGGDHANVADRFTADDLVAVSMLSVRIPGRAALDILDQRAGGFTDLLRALDVDLDLPDASDEVIGPESPSDRLWRALVGVPGIGWVTAGKLLARKRPRLIPLYDRVVKYNLSRPDGAEFWRPLRGALREHAYVWNGLSTLRAAADLEESISLLRVLDVVIWMAGDPRPERTPNSES